MKLTTLSTIALLALHVTPVWAGDDLGTSSSAHGRRDLLGGLLVVIAGPGEPGPLPELQTGRVLTLVLAENEKQRDAWRASLKPLLGLATVEVRADLAALPLPDRLVREIRVEDWISARQRGLTGQELLRVTAPGGTINVRGVDAGRLQTELGNRVGSVRTRDGAVVAVRQRDPGLGSWPVNVVGDPGNRRVSDDLLAPRLFGCLMHTGLPFDPITEQDYATDLARRPLWPHWVDGLPRTPDRGRVAGVVIADGFVASVSRAEWLALAGAQPVDVLVVRDFANGVPLWCKVLEQRISLIGMASNRVLLVHPRERFYALHAADGSEVWSESYRGGGKIALAGDSLLVPGESLRCLSAADGTSRWSANFTAGRILSADSTVVAASGGRNADPEVIAFSLTDGEELWRVPPQRLAGGLQPLNVGPDGALLQGREFLVAIDLRTGKELMRRPASDYVIPRTGNGQANFAPAFIHAGHLIVVGAQPKAWPLAGGLPQDLDPKRLAGLGRWACSRWGTYTDGSLRDALGLMPPAPANAVAPQLGSLPTIGTCRQSGPVADASVLNMPCSCACITGWVRGFLAAGYAPDNIRPEVFRQPAKLEPGPAFSRPSSAEQPRTAAHAWPCYRGDNERRSCATCDLSAKPRIVWSVRLAAPRPKSSIIEVAWKSRYHHPSRITPPVCAGGRVVVALPEEHQVVALDAAKGTELWRFQTGAAVDCPPTLHENLVLFGCRDGWLYCLSAKDGALCWRQRVAPLDRFIVHHGMLEAAWPVVGAVTVQDGKVYATAGLTGLVGIQLLVLDLRSGEVMDYRPLSPGQYPNDVLVADSAGTLAMGPVPLDAEAQRALVDSVKRWRVFGWYLERIPRKPPISYLFRRDGALFDVSRTDLPGAGTTAGGEGGWLKIFNCGAQGREGIALAWNDRSLAAVQVPKFDRRQKPVFEGIRGACHLAVWDTAAQPEAPPRWIQPAGQRWSLAMTDDAVLAVSDEGTAGKLTVFNVRDGATRSTTSLPCAPAQDGMAIADGSLFIALCDGTLVCLR